ncbi:DNA endonuclease SmrA [Aliiglaciecola litoralis]|uniref:DNA endonuclease SmrA n=1 Tax=Aliiglaciecola litoralis TaxID=582857 RepID=A0ABP3WYU6_9ALTE
MSNQRDPNDVSFMDAMQDVKPLPQNDRVVSFKPEHTLAQKLKRQALEQHHQRIQNYLKVDYVDPVDPFDHLSYKQSGIQQGVFKNLRLGKYPIENVIELQKLNFERARQRVFDGILAAHQRNHRTVLIKHGIGRDSKPFPAFMKSYVNQWLQQMPEVLAFYSAQPQHGGSGAVYALIKKSENEKVANRERHAKR